MPIDNNKRLIYNHTVAHIFEAIERRNMETMSGLFSNGKELTIEEAERLTKMYPQGWSYYAGDTCKHGVYVGGCGVDWMCQQCEDGFDEESSNLSEEENDKLLKEMDEENEARRDYISNGGSAYDF